ncbi:MAG: hypothetical protein ACNA8L_02025 [Luteolibacter sp.]|jgi:hypothetical protein
MVLADVMSFLRYFFTKADSLSSEMEGNGIAPPQSHSDRLGAARKQWIKQAANLDHGKRIARLETELADAGLVIESLIELLEERMGLTREEIEERVEQLSIAPVAIKPAHIPVAIPAAEQPVERAPYVLTTEENKDRFQPRRRWRDARGPL